MSIIGPSSLTRYRWQSFQLQANASIVQCGKVLDGDIVFSWNIFKGIQLIAGISSSSVDPRIFRVTPYTLDANTVYTFQVVVSLATNKRASSTAEVNVEIGVSGVISLISGGTQWTSSSSTPLLIDASGSYDVDYPSTGQLTYTWECRQYSPSYGANCPDSIEFYSDPSTTIPPNRLVPRTSYEFSVTVRNQFQATSTSRVVISIISGTFPSAVIITPRNKFNSKARVIIDSTVSVPFFQRATATWSSNDISQALLSSSCISALSNTFASNTTTLFQLALRPFSLNPGGTYSFQLSLANSEITITSTVQIVMNSPPYGGSLLISPPEGTALETVSF